MSGVVRPTRVEGEVSFAGGAKTKVNYSLFGPRIGLLLWRGESGEPRAATMADYNHRYWQQIRRIALSPGQRPKQFPIVDRFIPGDDDERDSREGLSALEELGVNVLMMPPDPILHEFLSATPVRRIAWAQQMPGGVLGTSPQDNIRDTNNWANELSAKYVKAGYKRDDMILFAMADEPSFFYPDAVNRLRSPAGRSSFTDYLRSQSMLPSEFGAGAWDNIQPCNEGEARAHPDSEATRHRFYWTTRFATWQSEKHFANCTISLTQAFPQVRTYVNWNSFQGRFFDPGPSVANPQRTDPNAAVGAHDWFEYARLGAASMLWTEDWFGNRRASQWSYYSSKMRSATAGNRLEFGGYIVPADGPPLFGEVQKALCMAGSGAKAIFYFVFGPEYNFPTNCYSEQYKVFPQIARTSRIIAAAEDLLVPGTRPTAEIAILQPRSAEVWDCYYSKSLQLVTDIGNTDPGNLTTDYLAEVYGLYLALQHANIPVDFIDEDSSAGYLARYKVLYLTEPDIPAASQQAIRKWIETGGTVVMVNGAAQADRYDRPCSVLNGLIGAKPDRRQFIRSVQGLKPSASIEGAPAFASGEETGSQFGAVAARFSDGKPAITQSRLGAGEIFYFPWYPGISYLWSGASAVATAATYSATLRELITRPVRLSHVVEPVEVDQPMLEAPILLSAKGALVTILNWSGRRVSNLRVTIHVPFHPVSVTTAEPAQLRCRVARTVTCSISVDDVALLMLRPR